MKYLIGLLIGFFSIFSCQKNNQKEINQSSGKLPTESKNYLNIKINNDLNVSIGELTSIDESINEDYEVINKHDTIYIIKQFLESDNIDGKNIKVLSNHKIDINVKYNVGFNFMGNEKESNYLPVNYIISKKINSGSILPLFEKIYNDIGFQNFVKTNKQKIYNQSYNAFIKYYGSITENDLKSCCPADYENYTKIKKINNNHLLSLDLEKDLITIPDYKSIIIDIKDLDSSKNYVVVFKKEKVEDLSKNSMITQKINWDGIYWLYPYNIDSEKQGNYYVNISKDNNEFGFSGDIQFNYKINYKSTDNKLFIFDNSQSATDPLAVIYKEKDKYYIKSDLIKMERTDLKDTKNGYPIRWAKSSDDVPDSPQ
ncbi:hypothetical protein [Chryseobacterium bernardetii]|uniref:hypothetical protein n=1 Tax=Chryseobacterium bernardetii TaxID=1241978 RepID=UPI003AF5EB4F